MIPFSIAEQHKALLERINLAIERITPCLGSLYLKIRNQPLQQFGSCLFVRARGEDYILTASHCFEKRKLGAIYVGGASAIAPLVGTFSYTQKRSEQLEPDDIDAAIAPLDPTLKKTIGAFAYPLAEIGNERIWPGPDPQDSWQRYTVIGFPSSKNKRPTTASKVISRNAWAFTTQVQSQDVIPQREYLDTERHLFLAWDYKQTEDADRQIINPPHLKGASGGAILSIGRHVETAHRPVDLVGILTDFVKPSRTIIGTRMSAIVDSLDAAKAWPRSFEASPSK